MISHRPPRRLTPVPTEVKLSQSGGAFTPAPTSHLSLPLPRLRNRNPVFSAPPQSLPELRFSTSPPCISLMGATLSEIPCRPFCKCNSFIPVVSMEKNVLCLQRQSHLDGESQQLLASRPWQSVDPGVALQDQEGAGRRPWPPEDGISGKDAPLEEVARRGHLLPQGHGPRRVRPALPLLRVAFLLQLAPGWASP